MKNFVQYSDTDWEAYMAEIESIFSASEARSINRAYHLSKDGHRKQMRDGGRRYFDHPREVSIICYKELRINIASVVIKALLHDISEDSFIIDLEGLELLFGTDVARSIRILTKAPKKDYILRMIKFGDCWDLVLKLSDRLHNIRTLDACGSEKIARKLKETDDEYLPLIDIARRKLPEEYKYIADDLDMLFAEAMSVYR